MAVPAENHIVVRCNIPVLDFNFPGVPCIIGIKKRHILAGCCIPAVIARLSCAHILRQRNNLYPALRILCRKMLQNSQCAIAAMVVNKHDLMRQNGLPCNR